MSEKAIFALEGFWDVKEYFLSVSGVKNIRVGYVGEGMFKIGESKVGSASAIELEYDPEIISYEDLLDHFWHQHDPTKTKKGKKPPAIFTLDAEQFDLAEESKKREQSRTNQEIVTEVLPATAFYESREDILKHLN